MRTNSEQPSFAVQATTPERADIIREVAGQASPDVEFQQFDTTDPEQTEGAAWALYEKGNEDGKGNVEIKPTLEQSRDDVKSLKRNGAVVVKLVNYQPDIWDKVRQVETERNPRRLRRSKRFHRPVDRTGQRGQWIG